MPITTNQKYNALRDRRLGKVAIDTGRLYRLADVIKHETLGLIQFFSDVIVLQINMDIDTFAVYTVIHPHFRPIQVGQIVPTYGLVIHIDEQTAGYSIGQEMIQPNTVHNIYIGTNEEDVKRRTIPRKELTKMQEPPEGDRVRIGTPPRVDIPTPGYREELTPPPPPEWIERRSPEEDMRRLQEEISRVRAEQAMAGRERTPIPNETAAIRDVLNDLRMGRPVGERSPQLRNEDNTD